jgi:methionine-rich copper-binding protein CopC
MKRRGFTVTAMALVLAGLAAQTEAALAHAKLKSAQPAADAKVQAGLKEIRLVFSEAVEPSLSSVEVDDAGGQAVASSKGMKICAKQTCKLALPGLAAGIYTVKFHVLSMDGHVVEGSYKFSATD